jgi:hypothetical protein
MLFELDAVKSVLQGDRKVFEIAADLDIAISTKNTWIRIASDLQATGRYEISASISSRSRSFPLFSAPHTRRQSFTPTGGPIADHPRILPIEPWLSL